MSASLTLGMIRSRAGCPLNAFEEQAIIVEEAITTDKATPDSAEACWPNALVLRIPPALRNYRQLIKLTAGGGVSLARLGAERRWRANEWGPKEHTYGESRPSMLFHRRQVKPVYINGVYV